MDEEKLAEMRQLNAEAEHDREIRLMKDVCDKCNGWHIAPTCPRCAKTNWKDLGERVRKFCDERLLDRRAKN